MFTKSYDQWFKKASFITALLALSGCMSMDESQWTTVSGEVRSQYGSHPAYTNLKESGTFMGGKTYSVVVIVENCSLGNAYARVLARAKSQANDPAWKGLLRIDSSHLGSEEGEISTFMKSTRSATDRGTHTQRSMHRVDNGVRLCITSRMSPGLFARTDDVIRLYAGIIDAVTAGQERVAPTPAAMPSSLPSATKELSSAPGVTLDVDAELEQMITKFADGLRGKKMTKVAVLDVVDLQGQKSELGRSLEEKIQISLVENKIKVIDRNHIQAILDEQKMSRAGLCNPEDAKKFGQISGADALVLGTITSRDNNYILMVKAISTETAEVVAGVKCAFSKSIDLEKMSSTGVK